MKNEYRLVSNELPPRSLETLDVLVERTDSFGPPTYLREVAEFLPGSKKFVFQTVHHTLAANERIVAWRYLQSIPIPNELCGSDMDHLVS